MALAVGWMIPGSAIADEAVKLRGIEVIGTAPLPGLGTPVEQIPSNVQTFGARELGRQRTAGVAEFLDLNANSVSLDAPTGNAFQPDVSFRGFTASSLLGTPQGLSVFQDGVRINEAFADVVNWDLIPRNAVASMQLLPGSNPVFGLNTLGGALTINMKDGFGYRGGSVEASGGSFGRAELAVEVGGNDGRYGYYVAAEGIDDDGFRDHSSSRIRRLYARGDARTGADELSLALTLADNHLEGTQALPDSMLGEPKQAYTWPDNTDNRLAFVNAGWQRNVAPDTVMAANGYYRKLKTSGTNSNVNDDIDPPAQSWQGSNVATAARTRAWGTSVQLTMRRRWLDVGHQIVIGAAYDTGTTDFAQSEQNAQFSADREAVGAGDFTTSVGATTTTRSAGAYLTDTIALDPRWTLVLSGRYDTARVITADTSGTAPEIDGTSSFRRFNPAAGLTWTPAPGTNIFGGVSRGMRIPTAVELTCADPQAPCTLPNIFVADPPLAPVLAITYEAGLRGRAGTAGFYSAAVFRTDLDNDIQFVAAESGAVNAGYFRNVGKTRRQGVELTGGGTWGEFSVTGRYSLLDATYRTAFSEFSPNNSTADAAGQIRVVPANRLPSLARNAFRVRADWARDAFAIGVTVLAVDGQYSRGNENNADPLGKVPGYALVALDASYNPAPQWQIFARIDNLFDAAYQNFGVLGSNYFRGPGNTFDASLAGPEPFRSPGAPFGVWIGVRYGVERKV